MEIAILANDTVSCARAESRDGGTVACNWWSFNNWKYTRMEAPIRLKTTPVFSIALHRAVGRHLDFYAKSKEKRDLQIRGKVISPTCKKLVQKTKILFTSHSLVRSIQFQ